MNKSKIFRVLSQFGVPKLLRLSKKQTVTVLSIHRISDEQDYFWQPITPKNFDALLKYVTQYYTVISFADIPQIAQASSKKPFLILSFDDGYYDFYEHALPILQKYQLPCNHNIVNSCASDNLIIWTQRLNYIFNHCRNHELALSFTINQQVYQKEKQQDWMSFYIQIFKLMLQLPQGTRSALLDAQEEQFSLSPQYRMMTWDEVIDCSKHNVEIGCHTYNHDVLSTIHDPEILRFEIIQAKKELEAKLNQEIYILAFPNGQSHQAVFDTINQTNFTYILHVHDSVNPLHMFQNQEVYNISRINMIDEAIPEMILRTELFHSKLRKYV